MLGVGALLFVIAMGGACTVARGVTQTEQFVERWYGASGPVEVVPLLPFVTVANWTGAVYPAGQRGYFLWFFGWHHEIHREYTSFPGYLLF